VRLGTFGPGERHDLRDVPFEEPQSFRSPFLEAPRTSLQTVQPSHNSRGSRSFVSGVRLGYGKMNLPVAVRLDWTNDSRSAHVLVSCRLPVPCPERLPSLVQRMRLQKVLLQKRVGVNLEQSVARGVARRQVHRPREDPARFVRNLQQHPLVL
jgi:hypothetical protein